MIIPDSIFDKNITVINIRYIVNQVNKAKKELKNSQIDKDKINELMNNIKRALNYEVVK